MQGIGKNGKLNLSPLMFNGLAIAFVLLLLPLSIAIISNASMGDVEYQSALDEGYYQDGAGSWRMNGANYTGYYQTLDPNAPAGSFSCGYIRPQVETIPNPVSSPNYIYGWCLGDRVFPLGVGSDFGSNYVVNNSSVIDSSKYIIMPKIESAGPSGKTVADHSNHLGGNNFDNYPIQWGINSQLVHNGALEILSRDPLNSIRITGFDSSTTYPCDTGLFGNATATYSMIFIYGNETLTMSNFKNTYYNGVKNTLSGDCSSYMELDYSFNNFQMIELDEFTGSQYENLSIIIQIDNIDVDNRGAIVAPYWGNGEFELFVDYSTNPIENVVGITRTATFALSLIIGYIAIASTPYYDPLRNLLSGAIE